MDQNRKSKMAIKISESHLEKSQSSKLDRSKSRLLYQNESKSWKIDKSISHLSQQTKRKQRKKKKLHSKENLSTSSSETFSSSQSRRSNLSLVNSKSSTQVVIISSTKILNYPSEKNLNVKRIGNTTTETTKSGKKGKFAKKKKKREKKLTADQIEKLRIEAELEEKRLAEEERIRLEEEKKYAIEKERLEKIEQHIRNEQLELSTKFIKILINYNETLKTEMKEKSEWELYLNCSHLPNPAKFDQMTTYLHLWRQIINHITIEDVAKRTTDVLELLNSVDNLIDMEKNSDRINNFKWIRLRFRENLYKSMQIATYKLLRNIESNLNRIDIPTADYQFRNDDFIICLWLKIQLPTPMFNPRKPPSPRIVINFKEMNTIVEFPLSIDCNKMAIRAVYVRYDHLSDLSSTYQRPSTPEQYNLDLAEAMKNEWRDKLKYKYDKRGENSIIGTYGDEELPLVPYRKLEPTASEFVINNEDLMYSKIRENLQMYVAQDVINLRKFCIIGGIYSLNLLYQPPQPQAFISMSMTITPLLLPKQLEEVPFYINYKPPKPPEAGVVRLPEEIEEELKKQEEELDKLMLVTLTWPDNVIFLELPIVCFWDETKLIWRRKDVFDLKHNEEKCQLTFRTGRFGRFGLATYRYSNLPYQAWELRPEDDGTVTLQITAAILILEFNIKNDSICLLQLQNSPNNAMQDIIGIYFKLPKLIRIMQSCGVDVFPGFDAFCYVEGTCEKHWPMEKHLYYNMAQLSICFNFAWSRWNLTVGRRMIVLQMREYNLDKIKQKNYLMLLVTPLKALYVDCTEVSQVFSEEGIENMKFYSDLYHLMKGTTSMAIRHKLQEAPKELIYSISELLIATRILSFS